ncbi:sigma-54 interaction domain-containing protein [Chromobacterium phragmitis]|uniref:Sigma-54-dependent Fis family transcriptional regulator n=1 Tax=Chromobacterium phragmitis TaxID=2202141 RepID=A0A344UNQ2_9NEIS|nr:sigma-54 dependent transcriptional regulator [Chromobacterium phragmitis]AXE36900.1 sigma-54-dependent Fis family transcriptional regulator [Chromobacterium phragmitis]
MDIPTHDASQPRIGADPAERVIGQSAVFQRLLQLVRRVAPTDKTVLIWGPTGAGKEVIAHELHRHSRLAGQPFIDLNCAAIPEHLMEAELFGHARGAFTGAQGSRVGLLAQVGRGTLFLDEIGELPLALQPKLLRVLETRSFRPLGSVESQHFAGRVVAATHRDLQAAVRDGRFREDLFYRLSVFVLSLPGLDQRRDDIPALIDHFSAMQPRPLRFSSDAVSRLRQARWPGNVRQLRSLVDRLGVLADGPLITADMLGEFLEPQIHPWQTDAGELADALLALPGEDKLEAAETLLLNRALQLSRGNKTAAARVLGVGRKVVERRLGARADQRQRLRELLAEGGRLIDGGDFAAAARELSRGLSLLEGVSLQREAKEEHFHLLRQLGICHSAQHGWSSAEAMSCYESALAVGKGLECEPEIMSILFGIWTSQLMSLELDRARGTAQQMLQRGQATGDGSALADAHFAMANTLFWLGDHAEVLACLDRGGLLRGGAGRRMGTQGFDLSGLVLTFEGLSAFQLGHFSRARLALEALLARRPEEDQPFSYAIALQGAVWLACLFEDDSLGKLAGEMEQLSRRHGFAFYLGIAQFFQGCELARRGEHPQAEAAMEEGYRGQMLRHGGKLFHSVYAWKRCELLLATGRADEGRQLAEHALELAMAHKERAYLGELLIARAAALRALGDEAGAEQGLRSALTMAEALGAAPSRVEAATRLAGMLAASGREEQARAALANALRACDGRMEPAHPVLQRARRLLGSLPGGRADYNARTGANHGF